MTTIIQKMTDLRDQACIILGTRPGTIMMSPIIRGALARGLPFFVIHSGQHYSYNMDQQFFEELELPEPKYKLDNVRQYELQGEQTAEMLTNFERILLEEKPRIVLVGGDTNSNLAAALAARKLHLCIAHLEAGERCFDWEMSEEHNRRMIDHICEYLLVSSERGAGYLRREHVPGEIFVTGNILVDAVRENLTLATEQSQILAEFGVQPGEYAILTIHREGNADSPECLTNILTGVGQFLERHPMPTFFMVHPRTARRIKEFGIEDVVKEAEERGLKLKDPLGYMDFLKLLANARLAFTDAGGVTKEGCVLRVPTVITREFTEWTEIVEAGASILAGLEPSNIAAAAERAMDLPRDWDCPIGDGRAADRILDLLSENIYGRPSRTLYAT